MNLADFINQWNGKPCDFDGAYGNQCVDLMNQYMLEVLGIKNPISAYGGNTAYEIYANHGSDANFDKITNTPAGVPSAGDIVFWNTSIGSAGHVAVFISGDINNFQSFDQNWPLGSYCHVQNHNYNGVAGWFHPKKGGQMACSATNKQGISGDANFWAQAYDQRNDDWQKDETQVIPQLKNDITQKQASIDSLQGIVNQRDKTVSDLTAQVTQLHAQLASQTGDVAQLSLGDLVKLILKKLGAIK